MSRVAKTQKTKIKNKALTNISDDPPSPEEYLLSIYYVPAPCWTLVNGTDMVSALEELGASWGKITQANT